MDRLGLWGEGTAFATHKDFTASVSKRGAGAMELVAMDLKARGMLLARTLTYVHAGLCRGGAKQCCSH